MKPEINTAKNSINLLLLTCCLLLHCFCFAQSTLPSRNVPMPGMAAWIRAVESGQTPKCAAPIRCVFDGPYPGLDYKYESLEDISAQMTSDDEVCAFLQVRGRTIDKDHTVFQYIKSGKAKSENCRFPQPVLQSDAMGLHIVVQGTMQFGDDRNWTGGPPAYRLLQLDAGGAPSYFVPGSALASPLLCLSASSNTKDAFVVRELPSGRRLADFPPPTYRPVTDHFYRELEVARVRDALVVSGHQNEGGKGGTEPLLLWYTQNDVNGPWKSSTADIKDDLLASIRPAFKGHQVYVGLDSRNSKTKLWKDGDLICAFGGYVTSYASAPGFAGLAKVSPDGHQSILAWAAYASARAPGHGRVPPWLGHIDDALAKTHNFVWYPEGDTIKKRNVRPNDNGGDFLFDVDWQHDAVIFTLNGGIYAVDMKGIKP